MLAECRDSYHLTHEVEVRGHQRHDPTAVKHRQAILVDDRAVLERKRAQDKVSRSTRAFGHACAAKTAGVWNANKKCRLGRRFFLILKKD